MLAGALATALLLEDGGPGPKPPRSASGASGAGGATKTEVGSKKRHVLCTAKKVSQCATLIVHANAGGKPTRHRYRPADDQVELLNITRLTPDGQVLSSLESYTPETVRVAAGIYELSVSEGDRWTNPQKVTVTAGQIRTVKLGLSF